MKNPIQFGAGTATPAKAAACFHGPAGHHPAFLPWVQWLELRGNPKQLSGGGNGSHHPFFMFRPNGGGAKSWAFSSAHRRSSKARSNPTTATGNIPLVFRGGKRLESTRLEGKINTPFSLPDSAIIETDADAPEKAAHNAYWPGGCPFGPPPDQRTHCPRKQDDVAVA